MNYILYGCRRLKVGVLNTGAVNGKLYGKNASPRDTAEPASRKFYVQGETLEGFCVLDDAARREYVHLASIDEQGIQTLERSQER